MGLSKIHPNPKSSVRSRVEKEAQWGRESVAG